MLHNFTITINFSIYTLLFFRDKNIYSAERVIFLFGSFTDLLKKFFVLEMRIVSICSSYKEQCYFKFCQPLETRFIIF